MRINISLIIIENECLYQLKKSDKKQDVFIVKVESIIDLEKVLFFEKLNPRKMHVFDVNEFLSII